MIMISVMALAAFILLVFIIKSVYLVQQAESMVVEKFGRYQRTLEPGLHVILPFMEQARSVNWTHVISDGKRYYREHRITNRIDLREAVYDFPKQNVITKDNVTMEINALLYYQITDPKAAVYEVANLPEAIEKLTQTTLRNVIGSLDLDESLVSRDAINTKLRMILDEATDKWGVKINRVELQEVNPPQDIRIAMEKQMRAERDRRAVILESEGKKRAAILEAEGVKEADILRAEGEAQAQIIAAQAEAEARLKITEAEAAAIQMIQKASNEGNALAYMISSAYIKALPKMAEGKEDKMVVLPYEATSLMGGLAGIKKILESV